MVQAQLWCRGGWIWEAVPICLGHHTHWGSTDIYFSQLWVHKAKVEAPCLVRAHFPVQRQPACPRGWSVRRGSAVLLGRRCPLPTPWSPEKPHVASGCEGRAGIWP